MAPVRFLPLVAIIVLVVGCQSVGGRLRPAWSRGWSSVTCTPAATAPLGELVVAMIDDYGVPLPGMPVEITNADVRVSNYTHNQGEVIFRLAPGKWRVSFAYDGFRPLTREIVLPAETRCRVELFVVYEQQTPIT
jgi:hypothetical protein